MRNSLSLAAVLLGVPSVALAHEGALLLGQQVITASRTGASPVAIAASSVITRERRVPTPAKRSPKKVTIAMPRLIQAPRE